jgi:hypothetical protein
MQAPEKDSYFFSEDMFVWREVPDIDIKELYKMAADLRTYYFL